MCSNDNIISDCVTTLCDKKDNGTVRPWREKKLANLHYFELLQMLNLKKSIRVKSCGEILEFNVTNEGKMRLARAWFCKSVLCPMCNWRKAMKRSIQTMKVVEKVIILKPTARWLFLTLTVKNVYSGDELDKSLKEMTEGFRRLMLYKKVKKNLIGFMRSTEITVNKKDGSYNQHMHVLLCVSSTYFKNEDNYLSQDEWTGLWKKAMKLDYTPVVHIEAVKQKKRDKKKEMTAIESAVKETAKYSVKDSDYATGDLEYDFEIVKDLELGLFRKRLVSYGGLLKEIHKQLNLDDLEDGDLVKIDEESDVQGTAYSIVARWNWNLRNYYID